MDSQIDEVSIDDCTDGEPTLFWLARLFYPTTSFLPQQQTPQPYTTGWQVLANRDHHTTLSANKQTTKVVRWYTHSQVKRQA